MIEISHSVTDRNDMVYDCKMIGGTMPESGGATALSTDWIGMGGVPGFQGVGRGEMTA